MSRANLTPLDSDPDYFRKVNPDGSRVMEATQEQLEKNRVPLMRRDYCAHLYIALENCKQHHKFSPFACHHEHHNYERCEYEETRARVAKKDAEKQQIINAGRRLPTVN